MSETEVERGPLSEVERVPTPEVERGAPRKREFTEFSVVAKRVKKNKLN